MKMLPADFKIHYVIYKSKKNVSFVKKPSGHYAMKNLECLYMPFGFKRQSFDIPFSWEKHNFWSFKIYSKFWGKSVSHTKNLDTMKNHIIFLSDYVHFMIIELD